MTVDPRPQSPGWYPDPDILPGSKRRLRYWNGSHWTDRRRTAPVLTHLDLSRPIGVPRRLALEGPARPVELPAPAAEISASREGPGGRADTLDHPGTADPRSNESGGDEPPGRAATLPATTGGRGSPPDTPGRGGDGGSGGDSDGRHGHGDDARGGGGPASSDEKSRTRRRHRWWLAAAVALVAGIGVTMAGEAMQPPSPGPRVLTDAQFVKAANADCARTMPTLRPSDGGPFGSAVTPTKVAVQIDTAASGLDQLAGRLGALPAADVDRPYIASWLDLWHQYDAAGHQYADYLRQHGATNKAPPMLATAARVAKSADNFARANGLQACEFNFNYNPDPSEF